MVPKISEYANSQNKVNAADFFSNHPFHLRLKEFSQLVFAPSEDGSFRESKWFYERARGQYQDARSNLTGAERRKFDLEYPKHQVISKTDLAKYLSVWQGLPDVVSKGAQKNFANFAAYIGSAWSERPDAFNEVYYRHAIAKAIVFRETEALVTQQSWYEGGYRANISSLRNCQARTRRSGRQRQRELRSDLVGAAYFRQLAPSIGRQCRTSKGCAAEPHRRYEERN